MAAPSAPNSDWYWVPDSTTENDYDVGADHPSRPLFRDSEGNLVWGVAKYAQHVSAFWSDDDGASWTKATNETAGNMDSWPIGLWFDPVAEVLFAYGSGDSDDAHLYVYEWDASTQALTYRDNVEFHTDTSDNLQVLAAISGVNPADTDEVIFVLLWNFDTVELLTTFTYDKGTQTVTEDGNASETSYTGSGEGHFFTTSGADPHHMYDPLNETIYFFGSGGTNDPWVEAWSHDGVRFSTSEGGPIEIDSGYNYRGTMFQADDDVWWTMHLSTDNLEIHKNTNTDPTTDNWVDVADYATDDGEATEIYSFNGEDVGIGFADGVFYFMGFDEDDANTDRDWVVITYDTATDSWETTFLGFNDSDFHSVIFDAHTASLPMLYDHYNESACLRFVSWLNGYSGAEEHLSMYDLSALLGGGAFVGFGPIPIAAT